MLPFGIINDDNHILDYYLVFVRRISSFLFVKLLIKKCYINVVLYLYCSLMQDRIPWLLGLHECICQSVHTMCHLFHFPCAKLYLITVYTDLKIVIVFAFYV